MSEKTTDPIEPIASSLEEIIAQRQKELTRYQSYAYAQRYIKYVEKIRATEEKAVPGQTALTEAVARALFKLMAIKDEYEVARLYTDGRFKKQLEQQFENHKRLEFHLAPPLLGKVDRHGHPVKVSYGPNMFFLFKILSSLRFLRATPFDIFGFTKERRMERRLISDYCNLVDGLLPLLDAAHHSLAVEIASLPMQLRGYGHVKMRHLDEMIQKRDALLASYRAIKRDHSGLIQAAE